MKTEPDNSVAVDVLPHSKMITSCIGKHFSDTTDQGQLTIWKRHTKKRFIRQRGITEEEEAN